MAGRFTPNQTGIAKIYGQVEDGLIGLAERITESAVGFAPKGKDKGRGSRREEHEVRVRVKRTAGGGVHITPKRKTSASAQRSINAFNANGGRPGTGSRLSLQKTLKGYVAVFGSSGRDAHIATSIRPSDVEEEGRRLRIEVRAHAKHAWYQEEGFNHKGGHQVAGQHYMLRGLEAHRTEIQSGAFIKKG